MNILALDLGTHTGYCRTLIEGSFAAGTWDLATKDEITAWGKDRTTRRCDPRILRLFTNLVELTPAPELVVFEDVQFQTFTYQTQLWSSFRAAVWLAFGGQALLECVPVSALKKFATGYGSANKELMKRYLTLRYPELQLAGCDDNAIDAIWIYKWAETNLARHPQK